MPPIIRDLLSDGSAAAFRAIDAGFPPRTVDIYRSSNAQAARHIHVLPMSRSQSRHEPSSSHSLKKRNSPMRSSFISARIAGAFVASLFLFAAPATQAQLIGTFGTPYRPFNGQVTFKAGGPSITPP